jgi:hypothetical protein
VQAVQRGERVIALPSQLAQLLGHLGEARGGRGVSLFSLLAGVPVSFGAVGCCVGVGFVDLLPGRGV